MRYKSSDSDDEANYSSSDFEIPLIDSQQVLTKQPTISPTTLLAVTACIAELNQKMKTMPYLDFYDDFERPTKFVIPIHLKINKYT